RGGVWGGHESAAGAPRGRRDCNNTPRGRGPAVRRPAHLPEPPTTKETSVLTRLRLVAGGTALAIGLCVLAASAPAAPPDLPKDSYKRAIDAEITSIQGLLKGGSPDKRAANTIKAEAMMLALYGEATGNAALTSQALQVAEAAAKKDWKGADAAAKGLGSPQAGAAPKGPLHEQAKFDLDAAMSPFRLGKVGGLHIEADIRGAVNGSSVKGL